MEKLKLIEKYCKGNYEYVFTECNLDNIEKIYELSIKLNQTGIYSHQIILNNNHKLYIHE